MPYYPSIDEDLRRAEEIVANGKDRRVGQFGSFPGDGTIYAADITAAYMLLKSFVEHIRYLHQQRDAYEQATEELVRFKRRAIRLNKQAHRRIRELEFNLSAFEKAHDEGCKMEDDVRDLLTEGKYTEALEKLTLATLGEPEDESDT